MSRIQPSKGACISHGTPRNRFSDARSRKLTQQLHQLMVDGLPRIEEKLNELGVGTGAIEEVHKLISQFDDSTLSSFDCLGLSDRQLLEYRELQLLYILTSNSYFLLEAFVWFVKEGLSPPIWLLKPIAKSFEAHLSIPDPELLPTQLGLSARGSGKTSPHSRYVKTRPQAALLNDMSRILANYEISKMDAARAAIIKHQSRLKAKTLVNKFNADRVAQRMSEVEFRCNDNTARLNFYRSFPPKARKLLRIRRP